MTEHTQGPWHVTDGVGYAAVVDDDHGDPLFDLDGDSVSIMQYQKRRL